MTRTLRPYARLLLVAGCLAAGGSMAAQQLPQTEMEKLKKELDVQRELIEAQTKLLEAQRAQQQAAEVADAKSAKTIAEAEKAAADARKAASEAQTAALKATIGEVPASGIQGSVELKDKAGQMEAALLAARAAALAAARISEELSAASSTSTQEGTTPAPKQPLLLYASSDIPSFSALLTFRAQTGLLVDALTDADRASTQAMQQAPPVAVVTEFLPAVGLGLDAASKILGYFRSDYAIGGIALAYDDSLLLHALAGHQTLRSKYQVMLPAQLNLTALSQSGSRVVENLKNLARLRVGVAAKVPVHERIMAQFASEAAKAAEPKKRELQSFADVHQQAVAVIKGALALHDSFLAKLTTGDEKANAPLSLVIREDVIARALDSGAALLVIKLQASGGAHYTKKNLWTFFGGMPYYNMGGVVASYVLMSGKNGEVLKSGVVPIHGGFTKLGEVQGLVER